MYGTYLRLGLHVSATDREVIRQASTKLHPKARFDRRARTERHKFYHLMLSYHKDARNLYRDVMRGELDGE